MKVAPSLSAQAEDAPGTADTVVNMPLSQSVSGHPVENFDISSTHNQEVAFPDSTERKSSTRCIALQWNVNGIRERYAELQLITSEMGSLFTTY